MDWELYDYVGTRHNEIKAWTEQLGKRDRAKLNIKLDVLRKSGPYLSPRLLAGTGEGNIKKLRFLGAGGHGQALRPHLCRGPINCNSEFTLLVGAVEKDGKLPVGVLELAVDRRKGVIQNPSERRCSHERVT